MADHKKSTNHSDCRIGYRIRLQRMALGISQEKLGEALGVSFQQIQKYENGRNRVSASRLEKIAAVLEVPVTFFYDENGEAQDAPQLVPDTQESRSLLRAFQTITHPILQKKVLAFVRTIAAMKM